MPAECLLHKCVCVCAERIQEDSKTHENKRREELRREKEKIMMKRSNPSGAEKRKKREESRKQLSKLVTAFFTAGAAISSSKPQLATLTPVGEDPSKVNEQLVSYQNCRRGSLMCVIIHCHGCLRLS